MTDVPPGAPAPQPDLERRPRTKITRLPYLVVLGLALIVVTVIGLVTARERATSQDEMVTVGAGPQRAQQVIEAPPPR